MSADLVNPVDRDYGDKVVAVELGGNEPIPAAERHGSPLQLTWTWSSPNLEFATVFVGVLAVKVFGLGFGPAVAAMSKAVPAVGDITFLVGFAVAAAAYVGLFSRATR